MKIGLCTDSHDHLKNLRRAMLEFRRRGAEAIVHCGDFVAPFTIDALKLAGCPVYAVYGNCDGERHGLKKRFAELPEQSQVNAEPHLYQLNGVRIIAMHHPNWVDAFAKTEIADIVVYGHLHRLHLENRPPWIINPGEIYGLKEVPTAVWFDTETSEPEVIELAGLPDQP